MHNLLVQCLIALISKEFSPEEFREILEETKNLPIEEKKLYWAIGDQIPQARESLRARFGHSQNTITHRQIVKEVLAREEEQANTSRPVLSTLKATMDFS